VLVCNLSQILTGICTGEFDDVRNKSKDKIDCAKRVDSRCGDEEASRFAPIFGVKSPDVFNLPKYQAWVRIGTDNILIETYPPKLIEISDIDISKAFYTQSEIMFHEHEYNFLDNKWIEF